MSEPETDDADIEAQEQPEPVISEPEPTEEEPVEEKDPLDDIVDACIAAMSLEDKVAGLFLITPEQLTGVSAAIKAGDATQEALNQHAVGGMVYQKQNMKSQEQFTQMLSTTATMSRYPMFFAVAEAGANGTVSKSAIPTGELSSFAKLTESGDPTSAYTLGQTMADYLVPLGINLNLAISANLDAGEDSFGTDGTNAMAYVQKMVSGLQEKKVGACLTTFPGMSDADSVDTDQGMAVITCDADELRNSRFPVFRAGIEAGAQFCMIGNVSAPNVIGDNTPCVLNSVIVTELLRGELGFEGVIISDAFTDKAITEYYTSGEAAVKAIRAGVDMILVPESFEEAYQGVLEAVNTGALTEERINESLHRIYRVKYADRVPEEVTQ